jgi:hypothetical protein
MLDVVTKFELELDVEKLFEKLLPTFEGGWYELV